MRRERSSRRASAWLAAGFVAFGSAPGAAQNATWRGVAAPLNLDAMAAPAPGAGERRLAAAAALPPGLYGFSPQGGRPGLDQYVYNYVDLDPAFGEAATLDWDCSRYTYDGHGGHDLLIRGFREQAIGVPIVAALAGDVVTVVDHHPDDSVDTTPKPNNVIVLDHGGGHRTIYYHLRTGSALVAPGERVAAGQQIASVGSSGVSSAPHLHFETRVDGFVVEPSTGPCQPGASLWTNQEPVSRDVYLREAFFSAEPFPLYPDLASLWRGILLDQRPRLGSAVLGQKGVHLWVEFFNLPGGAAGLLRVFDPRGALRAELLGSFGLSEFSRAAFFDLPLDVTFDRTGDWRVTLAIPDGGGAEPVVVLDTRLRVVANARQVKNRPPTRIRAALEPPRVDPGRPLVCRVETSLTRDDPDHDLVSYAYEWRIGNRTVRTAHAAALADILPAGLASAKDRVACRVRPFDGVRFGPVAETRAR